MGPRSGKAGRHRVESRCAIQPALTVRVQEEETKHLGKRKCKYFVLPSMGLWL